jgi:hypothetical protein
MRMVVLVVGIALGCTPRERAAPSPTSELGELDTPACAPMRHARSSLPAITTLVTRDHELTVYASDDGLRFSVARSDGSTLGHMLTATELEQTFPALHRRFDATFAGDARWLDASLEGLRTPEPLRSR